MTSTIKVNNIQNQCGQNIINESSNTITLGASGDTIALASGASQTGFGRTGTVDWDTTPKTATFTAVSGDGFFANTTASAFNMNLPAGVAGAIVSVADYAATWNSNNLTVVPNGTDKIGGVNASVALSTKGQSVTFIFVDSTQGWVNTMDSTSNVRASLYVAATGGCESTCGDFKIHTFTGPGTLCVSAGGSPSGSDTFEYIVVAGGGGGGLEGNSSTGAGGGGAGGFRFASPSLAPATYPGKPLAAPAALTAAIGSFPITVGGGGSGSTNNPAPDATRGSNSIFSSITSAGGGAGAYAPCGTSTTPITPGGSGGGGSVSGAPARPGLPGGAGTGNTPPVSPAQGTNGGNAYCGGGYRSGGGGGAIVAGVPSPNGNCGGQGGCGAGIPTAFGSNGVPCGSFRYYSGGGGGGGHSGGGLPAAAGGKGGGGASSPAPGTAGVAGTTNSGGGGGGGAHPQPSNNNGGNGGSGIVVIRYKFQN